MDPKRMKRTATEISFTNIALSRSLFSGHWNILMPLISKPESMRTTPTLLLTTLVFGFAGNLLAQESPPLTDQHVTARLIGESAHVQPGSPYRLGLLLSHDPGWHTYWKSTATGYATSIDWDLPAGVRVSDIRWPTPKVYDFQGWTEYVYEGKTLLMMELLLPETYPAASVVLEFTAEWLMCEAVCIPGTVSSRIEIPVRNTPAPPSKWAPTFAQTDRLLPSGPGDYAFSAWQTGDSVVLEVEGVLPQELYFFDAQGVFTPKAGTIPVAKEAGSARIPLTLDPASDGMPERLVGVLKAKPGWPAQDGRPGIKVDIPIAAAAPASPSGGMSAGLLALAFAGGLILNLMPCVFPVLGIKIMGFVGQAGSSRAKVVGHGLVFTGGVLLSFWILAAVLLILRSGGEELGWGFQLQSPGFVLALSLLLFAFGLNMSGLFEVGQSAVGVGSNLTGKGGFAGSFFSGVLATVVATPCAAPFLAPALGAALALPPFSSFVIFTVIAVGLSLPYLTLSAFPSLIEKLPRPGPWMETFKQLMSFLLYATVAFLLWVLAGQMSEDLGYPPFAFLKVLFSLVLLSLALWVYGKWAAFSRPRAVRLTGSASAVLLVAVALWTGFSGTQPVQEGASSLTWVKWEPGKAASLSREGKIVYVDFTARWCVTCQTNKAAVFRSSRVRELFRKEDIVPMKADWTNKDPEISEALARFGRSAVPFNLLYGPAQSEPVILPELLTPGIVIRAIEDLSAP